MAYRETMDRRSILVALLATFVMQLVSGLGCKSKQSLDADVDHLLVAIASADYELFKADAHPSLVNEVSKEEFDGMVRVLEKLGPLESKRMTSIHVQAGGPAEGQYDMKFTNGSCKLQIKSLDGKLVAFHFTGSDIDRLLKSE
jgi:hypothetical protein